MCFVGVILWGFVVFFFFNLVGFVGVFGCVMFVFVLEDVFVVVIE